MYAKAPAKRLSSFSPALVLWTLAFMVSGGSLACAQPQVIRNITQETERLELTVNSSKVLTLDKRIPRMVVNNPELVTVTALSANEIQLAARKPGVTQVNLWDEEGHVFTVDVLIYGDVKELEHALARIFPGASVKVVRLTNSLVLEGFVERPEDVSPIVRLAEDYAPKIVNNITVGGVQQVLLKVKVMEVSRTKLRNLGFDFAQFGGSGGAIISSISGLITDTTIGGAEAGVEFAGNTVAFGIVDGSDTFLGLLDALQRNNVAKILADPTLTAVSGRPAHFNVGGELPIVIPSGLGQTTVEYKKFGTQIDFVPIVLGNGNIRLEVRPRVSEIDDTRSIQLQDFSVPALRVREVDTGVEMKAGQTLAIAGLVQTRVEAREQGLPYLGDLPYIGAAFRSVREEVNEIELLILVTPEFADGMEPHEVPQCGPGMESVSPTNCQLYFGGHLEVPACGPCGPGNYGACNGAECNNYDTLNGQCSSCNMASNMPMRSSDMTSSSQMSMPSGKSAVVSDSGGAAMSLPPTNYSPPSGYSTGESAEPIPAYQGLMEAPATTLPPSMQQQRGYSQPMGQPQLAEPAPMQDLHSQSRYQMPAQYTRENPNIRTSYQQAPNGTSTPGLIGPIGYDVEK